MSLEELPRPLEILELGDGKSEEFYPLKYQEGFFDIQPKDTPIGQLKRIKVLRVFYDKDPLTAGLDYWDITSTTLITQLLGSLDNGISQSLMLKITAFGVRPKTRFMVSWVNSTV